MPFIVFQLYFNKVVEKKNDEEIEVKKEDKMTFGSS